MTTGAEIIALLKEQIEDIATVDAGRNSAVFTIRGWPFAVIRNGCRHWDILNAEVRGIEACPEPLVAGYLARWIAIATE